MLMSRDGDRRMLRWGIVGTGRISRQVVADFAHTDQAAVVAACSRTRGKADRFANDLGIPYRYDDFEEMLGSDIDAVYIGTPSATHFPLAADALRRGRHVLCEKPLGLDAAQVRQLAIIAEDNDVFLMEAMWMKFNPLYTKLLELIEAGSIGEVSSIRAAFGSPVPDDPIRRSAPRAGALLDRGIYPVTLSHLLFGAPSRITAGGQASPEGVDLSVHFTLGYPSGRFVQGASSTVDYLDQSASVSGTRGWIAIGPGFWFASELTLHHSEGGRLVSETHGVDRVGYGYVPMLREVTAVILDGRREHPRHSLEETVSVFDTLDGIRAQLVVPGPPDR
jgi:predicted dehydrogenase